MATTDDEAIALCALLGVVIGRPGGKYWRYKLSSGSGFFSDGNAPFGWSGPYDEAHWAARDWLEQHGYTEEAKRIVER